MIVSSSSGMLVVMGLLGVLGVALIVLAIAALVKYLFSGRRP